MSDQPLLHLANLYSFRSEVEFEREIDYLLCRFSPVSLGDLAAWKLEHRPLPRRAFFLSFDDGFREMAEVVAPLCRRKGVSATFFLTTDFLDNQALGYRHKASVLLSHLEQLPANAAFQITQKAAETHALTCGSDIRQFILSLPHSQRTVLDETARLAGLDFQTYLKKQCPYLTTNQVRELHMQGFDIGAHSVDHPRYSELTLSEQIRQTRDSVRFIEQNFHPKHRAFAFPFVSDGVDDNFYLQIFSERICDIVFCIGQTPRNKSWPIVERFGIEGATNDPIWRILRNRRRRALRADIGRAATPIKRLLRAGLGPK